MKQRVQVIDGLRGVSLLGILLANMLIFQYGFWGKEDLEHFHLFTGDHVAYMWLKIFVESSFMPIFMFLFGYSMILMKEKLEAGNGKVKRHFFRRSLLLMAFGFGHTFYLFEGDILLSYGLMGMVMLLFLNRKKKTLLVWALILLILSSFGGFGGNILEEPDIARGLDLYVEKANQIYTYGSYEDIIEFRMSPEDPLDLKDIEYVIVAIIAPFAMLPMFLLGMFAAKSRWFQEPNQARRFYILGSMILIPISLLLKSLPHILINSPWAGVLAMFGSSTLALGYIFAFVLLYSSTMQPSFFRLFEQVGRLSMTNYLLQSVICSTIFYSYGLGLFGQIGVINGILLALVIYGLQVMWSHWYVNKWKMGPAERMIRWGTYLTWNSQPKIKSTANVATTVEGIKFEKAKA